MHIYVYAKQIATWLHPCIGYRYAHLSSIALCTNDTTTGVKYDEHYMDNIMDMSPVSIHCEILLGVDILSLNCFTKAFSGCLLVICLCLYSKGLVLHSHFVLKSAACFN